MRKAEILPFPGAPMSDEEKMEKITYHIGPDDGRHIYVENPRTGLRIGIVRESRRFSPLTLLPWVISAGLLLTSFTALWALWHIGGKR